MRNALVEGDIHPIQVAVIATVLGDPAYVLRVRLDETDPRQDEVAVLDGDPARCLVQLQRLVDANDRLVDLAEHGVEPVHAPDLLEPRGRFGRRLQHWRRPPR